MNDSVKNVIATAILVLGVALGTWLIWRGETIESSPPAPVPGVTPASQLPALKAATSDQAVPAEVDSQPAASHSDPPGLVIAGAAITEDGTPASGAVVAAYTADNGATRAVAGEDGSFRVVGLDRGAYRVSAALEHYNEAVLEGVAAGASDVRLVLAPLSAVEGRVVEATTGTPVVEFDTVYLKLPPGDEGHWQNILRSETTGWNATQDPQGRYRIEDIASGAGFAVGARAPGCAPGYVTVTALRPGETGGAPDIVLEPESRIRGRIVSSTGSAVSGAAVYLGHEARGRAVARTDSDGQFIIGQFPSGIIQLTAAHAAHLPATLDVNVASGQETVVEIVLGGGGAIEGYVVDGAEPLRGQTVTASRLAPPRVNKQAVTDAQGFYAIEGLSPGIVEVVVKVQLEAEAKPVRVQTQATVEEGSATVVDFDLSQAVCAVEGYVTVSGVPQPAAQIQGLVAGEGGDAFFNAYSGEDGWYALENIPPGSAWLDVTAIVSGREQHKKVALSIPPGDRVRQDVDFSGTGSIYGAVGPLQQGEGGQVLLFIGAVEFEPTDADIIQLQAMQVAASDIGPGGAYAFTDLDDGTYTLAAVVFDPDESIGTSRLPALRFASTQVTVSGAQPVEVNLPMP